MCLVAGDENKRSFFLANYNAQIMTTHADSNSMPNYFCCISVIFDEPLVRLFNLSLATYVVPQQWKAAFICPVLKVQVPKDHIDFRPISITPVLTRIMERTVVKQFVYPAIHNPPPSLTFGDQFAFRTTGSTTSAITAMLHTITHLLSNNPYVTVIAFDFSKAFYRDRHFTLYSWLMKEFLL